MTDTNATEVQINTDTREMMTRTIGHDRAAEAKVGGGNRKHVARVQNTLRIVARNLLLLREMETVRDTTRDLIGAMVGTVAEAQTT